MSSTGRRSVPDVNSSCWLISREQLDAAATELRDRLPDGRERRPEKVERADIVEADHRKILRNPHPVPPEHLEKPDGDLIRAREHRRGSRAGAEQVVCRRAPVVGRVGVARLDDHATVRPGFRQRLAEARKSLGGAEHAAAGAHEGNAPMPGLDQMSRRQPAACLVVEEDLRGLRAWHVLVENDDAPDRIDALGERAVIAMVGDKDQAVHMVAAQPVDIVQLAGGVVQRGAEDDAQSDAAGRRFRRRGEAGEERVGDIGDDEPDRVRAAETEPPRMRVGAVVERTDRGFDPIRRTGRQDQRPVQVA